MYENFFKRFLDIMLSLVGLIISAVPMLIVALITVIDSKGPALFKQKRIGIHKKEFMILKFRSMPIETPSEMPTHMLKNSESFLSPWQKFIRKTSIDELPQLINILKGDMSLIGPRPALWNQYDLIAERDKYGANDIRPGLTGWAQINGRDELEISQKARLDGEYVENLNLAFDFKCFFGTVISVVKSEGVVEGGTGAIQEQAKISQNEENKAVDVK